MEGENYEQYDTAAPAEPERSACAPPPADYIAPREEDDSILGDSEEATDEESDGAETELGGSRLGRKKYWEATYRKELQNFAEHGDEGEVWFGREVLDTVVQWTGDLLRRIHGPDAGRKVDVLDVGCGNGTMLVGLAAQGFERLAGSDYSMASIELARRVLARHGLSHITLRFDDLLNSDYGDGVHVITDKGTLDAVGLSNNPDARRKYRSSMWHLLRPVGYLVITSCNSTREELVEEFCSGPPVEQCAYNMQSCRHSRWRVVDWVKTHPTFRFGGVEGSKVATVAFEKLLPPPGRVDMPPE